MNASLKRTAQLGLLARDLASVRACRKGPGRDAARNRLVDRLGLLHGLPQKIGQLLSFSEIENSDPCFTRLTENEPSLTSSEARAEVERQLGGPIHDFFKTFSDRGISASIGQVHRATLLDGRSVAVKIQYPGIAQAVGFDLKALGWLTAPIGDLRRGFDLKAYRVEIGTSLERELDYKLEAGSLRRFSELASTLTWPIALPSVIESLSNRRLLTTTWLDGESLGNARQWPASTRRQLSCSLIELFFKSLLQWGWLHADPHAGNYRFLEVRGRPTVGLLDFGCVKQVPDAIQQGIAGLIQDACNRVADGTTVEGRFVQMGFNPGTLARLSGKLADIAEALTLPFTTKGPFDAARWNLQARLSEILEEDRMTFRTAGPPEIIFILRAFQGLLHQLKLLDAPVDWTAAAGLQNGRSAPPPPSPTHPTPGPTMLSETLNIRVHENGVQRAALTFGAGATDNLPDLVPHELRGRLAERAVDLKAIAESARRRDYAPGELFALADGPKTVRVWLE